MFLCNSLRIREASGVFFPLLLHMLHEWCVLPATRTLLNEGMVLLSSPNEEQSSIGSKPLEGLCVILPFLTINHRIMSRMLDGYIIFLEVFPYRHVLPKLLPVQNHQYGLLLFVISFLELTLVMIRFVLLFL